MKNLAGRKPRFFGAYERGRSPIRSNLQNAPIPMVGDEGVALRVNRDTK